MQNLPGPNVSSSVTAGFGVDILFLFSPLTLLDGYIFTLGELVILQINNSFTVH